MTRRLRSRIRRRRKRPHGAVGAQDFQHVVDHAVEQAAQQQGRTRPDHGAHQVIEQEAAVGGARQARHDGGQRTRAGQELAHQQRPHANAQVQALRLADAGILRQRHLADHAQQARAVTAAGNIPEGVGQEAGHGGRQPRRQPSGRAAQGTRRDQHGIGGHGQARLFDQDVREHQPPAVLLEQQLNARRGPSGALPALHAPQHGVSRAARPSRGTRRTILVPRFPAEVPIILPVHQVSPTCRRNASWHTTCFAWTGCAPTIRMGRAPGAPIPMTDPTPTFSSACADPACRRPQPGIRIGAPSVPPFHPREGVSRMKSLSTPSVGGIARRGVLKLAAAAAAGALLFSGAAQAQAPAKTRVAAIYTVPVEQQWVSRIHKALTAARDRGEIEYTFSENVTNADYERVMRQYAEQGNKLVVGEAFAVEAAARKVAKDYPQTAFLMGNLPT
ncbi:hypothetical protein G6F35_010450 [Rhizopus arrhizus]|nr:hypothetical protein G6F35_010450 [Rhizopus arrhizus]